MRVVALCVLTMLAALSLSGQTGQPPAATVNSRFAFDQDAPDLASVQGYTFRVYIGTSTTGTILAVTCAGETPPFQCSSPLPPLPPGTHVASVTAANEAGEGPKSDSLTFRMVVAPGNPTRLRIQP